MSDFLSDSDGGQQEEEATVDLTPMLDVVFIMLIFFIVTATFVKEAGIDVQRPEAQTAVRQDKANILIAISQDDEIWIDGNSVDERDLTATIKRLHSQNPQGAVVIQADKDSTHQQLKKVMEAASDAGVGQLSVAAEQAS